MVSSYQTLARFADERPGNRMPDIRQQMRQDLLSSRCRTKRARLLGNRRLRDFSSECDDEESNYEESNYEESNYEEPNCDGYDEPDYHLDGYDPLDVQLTTWGNIGGWPSSPEPNPSNTPSPCLSDTSNRSSTASGVTSYQCDNSRKLSSTLSQCRSTLTRKEKLELKRRVRKSTYNLETISSEFDTLKRCLIEQAHNPRAIGFVLCSRWNVVADAINSMDENLSKEAIILITQLTYNQLIDMSDILFILQQGLILTLRDTISRLGSQQVDVLAFLTCLIYIEPRATSYIIELIADMDIIKVLEEFIEFGTESEASLAIKFYSSLIDIETGLYQQGNYHPIVPDTLSRTISRSELARTYCPLAAIKRIIRPNFIAALLSRFYKPVGVIHELDLFNMATGMLITSMSLIYRYTVSEVKDLDWVNSMLHEFELCKFDQQIYRIVQNQDTHRLDNKCLELSWSISSIYSEVVDTYTKVRVNY